MTQRINFTNEQLNLLDDIIEYYVLADYGGGERTWEERQEVRRMRDKIWAARERANPPRAE